MHQAYYRRRSFHLIFSELPGFSSPSIVTFKLGIMVTSRAWLLIYFLLQFSLALPASANIDAFDTNIVPRASRVIPSPSSSPTISAESSSSSSEFSTSDDSNLSVLACITALPLVALLQFAMIKLYQKSHRARWDRLHLDRYQTKKARQF